VKTLFLVQAEKKLGDTDLTRLCGSCFGLSCYYLVVKTLFLVQAEKKLGENDLTSLCGRPDIISCRILFVYMK
jgi:hypothetical protein